MKMTPLLWFATVLAATYPWCLPWLASVGFASTIPEGGFASLSAYIDTPSATGALAGVSMVPLMLVVQHSAWACRRVESAAVYMALRVSQLAFAVGYASFLAMPVSVNKFRHFASVVSFVAAFGVHAVVTLAFAAPSRGGLALLVAGVSCTAVLSVLFVLGGPAAGFWFWWFECLAFACMVFFTPVEITAYQTPHTTVFPQLKPQGGRSTDAARRFVRLDGSASSTWQSRTSW